MANPIVDEHFLSGNHHFPVPYKVEDAGEGMVKLTIGESQFEMFEAEFDKLVDQLGWAKDQYFKGRRM